MAISTRPSWAPERVHTRGTKGITCHFDMVAPITGDAIYKGMKDNAVVHMLVPAPDAVQNQNRAFKRGGF